MTLETEYSLWQNSLVEFRSRVAAATPTPGGGAVAAVTATLAAALLRMVGAICLRRQPDESMKAALTEVQICEEKLARYADEDVRAFDRYMAVRKDRKTSSPSNVQEKLLACTRVPLEAAEQVAKLQSLTAEIARISPAFVASDIETAVHLLHASRQSLLANVKINLNDLEPCDEKLVLQQRLERLLQVDNAA